jgi:two-component system response regulator BaeR
MPAQTILVVEDEPRIAAITADYLRHAGYTVVGARDGAEALHRVGASRPDLVVLDLGLPAVDFEVARTIRATSSLPIMVTAEAEEDR